MEESRGTSVFAKNQVELANLLGVCRKTISRYKKLPGAPIQRPDNRYDVAAWKEFLERQEFHGRSTSSSKEELEREKLRLQNEKLQIEIDTRRGQSIDLEEACQVFAAMVSGFREQGRAMRHDLGPKVVGVEVGEATKRIGVKFDEV